MYYTWGMGLLGGVMIGTAAAVMLLFNGRIMGASGIIAGLWQSHGAARWEQTVFVLGLLAAPAIAVALMPTTPLIHAARDWPILAVAGLLVGIGTRLANGCTSGHGVCGITRGSMRSSIATLAYVGAGMVTVFVVRHLWGLI
ncbi:hypothetical protein BFP70_08325 [Thioclava sp. SK-1]|uniref:YeeE/YedE family protein n=1 Tax=Thioclava sp. SK-1 TaxID=1889770 RepID=UPI000825B1CF|nr:YeeE/YedE thiosulfate transporter family protein [Thioclava sp. SK-1]OCX66105.1 hypothetical protein BFP70_08325 [Thioclava sp. SK-1]